MLVQTHRIKNIIEEEKHSLSGIFKLGILPTIAPYLCAAFPSMKKYPQLDIRGGRDEDERHQESPAKRGDIDAGIVAGLAGNEEIPANTVILRNSLHVYCAGKPSFSNEVIRTSDLTGEQLWAVDEGHCFRDQLERFCQAPKAARASQLAYHLGQHGNLYAHGRKWQGHHFHFPNWLSCTERREETGRSLLPSLSCKIIMLTNRSFIRSMLLNTIVQEVTAAVPKKCSP